MNYKQNNNKKYFIVIYKGIKVKIYTETEIKSDYELQLKIFDILNIHPYFQRILGWVLDQDENYDYVPFTNTFYYPLQNRIYIGLENNHRMDFETEKGFTFHLDISQSDSIYQIKQKIENKTNIPVEQQK